MNIKENYNRWMNSPLVDEKSKSIMREMNQEQIDDAFFKDVEFGTAGMRGVLGPGTNRLNEFTIKKATVAFAMYLLDTYKDAKEKGVVISHDNRHMSREFTLLTSHILNDFGINTYIFDSLRPTPELSYAVRYLKAVAGVMITASHNPKEYNGYKVYDENGCQLVPSKIKHLLEIIASLPDELSIKYTPSEILGKEELISSKLDDDYVKEVESIQLNPHLNKKGFKIVYTPQHGTSYVNAMRIFNDLGYEVYPVLSQCDPDPDFSGTLTPNPEDKRAYIEPIKLAKKINAQLIVMTDPDGDRVGLAYLNQQNEYSLLTGNESAAMLMDYVFSQRKKQNKLSENGVMYNTIVTSSLGSKVASKYGIKTEAFLTGFKFIGDRIDYYEKHGGPTFEFGYEESYGCLIKPFARDKDGLQAILLYCEMALYHYLQGKTLDIVFDELQKELGYHNDVLYSIEFKGPQGLKNMQTLMSSLRNNPISSLADQKVIQTEDYLKSIRVDNKGHEETINLPPSDVIKIYLNDGSIVAIRPSGTEPKCKFYIGVVGKKKDEVMAKPNIYYEALKKDLNLE